MLKTLISLQARELLENNQLGDEPGVTQTQAQLTITVQDTNNNAPVFTPRQHTAVVVEPALGQCGQGGPQEVATLDVSDMDQVTKPCTVVPG